jgi:hypothetical protein
VPDIGRDETARTGSPGAARGILVRSLLNVGRLIEAGVVGEIYHPVRHDAVGLEQPDADLLVAVTAGDLRLGPFDIVSFILGMSTMRRTSSGCFGDDTGPILFPGGRS